MENYFTDGNMHFLENDDFTSDGMFKYNQNGKPMVLMVAGGFCGHCKRAAPMFDSFAKKNKGKVFCSVVVLDGDKSEQELGKRLSSIVPKLSGVPAFLLFLNGYFRKMYHGPRTIKGLEEFVSQL